MKEKLLAALKTKFQGVSEKVLDRLVDKKAETVEKEDQIQTIVDGLNYQDVIDSEADFRGMQISKTKITDAITDYEKKHNLKDGKPQKDPDLDPDPDPDDKGEKVPEWAQKLIKENSELKQSIQGITKSQEVGTKRQQAQALMEKSKIPEKLRSRWINRVDLDSETPLEDQVTELETEYVDLQQDTINAAVKEGDYVPGSGTKEFESKEVDDYLSEKFPEQAEK